MLGEVAGGGWQMGNAMFYHLLIFMAQIVPFASGSVTAESQQRPGE